ncbi:CK1/CK1 protein kinase [Fomitiporia mediterranea MF3/22]|uniref:CK1/CK1 protein kinase n=1 Tax=Fomitiporia mediterranea (strain MF3/22) TaxID=694068 RepID=UPI0004407F28|nr:CK1/CK1 protein kinase [Fomitiporia mediterranea MF3/22]EJC98848.1 CK1/CK1 protein kinase [Fomitiporia mediterranea MF3/22]
MGGDDGRHSVPARIGNWLLDQNLGAGYSGSIWRATNPYTGQVAAVKVQDVDHECPTNRYERNFYPSLQGGKGMPTLWAAGVQGEHDYLVIDLLGASLDNLYRKNGKMFDLRSTICIAMQVIQRLEFMHSRGILHRDIQLGNCTLGLGRMERVIYMIDFGFSKRYIDPRTRKHIPDSRAKRDFIGNYWFSSVNVHCRGRVPSRRDDMEALALMLIHVLTEGGLPWTRNGVPKTDKAHDILIRQKQRAKPEELCHGLPPVFEDFLRYCRRLKFFEQPDYRYWRDQFADLAREVGYAEPDGSVNDDLVWPPRPDEAPVPYRTPASPPRRKAEGEVDIYHILEEIAKMRLDNTKLVKESKRNANLLPVGKSKTPPIVPNTTSDNSETPKAARPQADRATKQATLRLLTRRVREQQNDNINANTALADLLKRFLEMYSLGGGVGGRNRSRVITKDAFEFLDALVERLGTQSRLDNRDRSVLPPSSQQQPREGKIETVRALRHRLLSLPSIPPLSSIELSRILGDFCAAVRSTTGKTLTKDGVAFLEGVEERLRQLAVSSS